MTLKVVVRSDPISSNQEEEEWLVEGLIGERERERERDRETERERGRETERGRKTKREGRLRV